MAYKTIKVADITPFANGDSVSLVGKNGFTSKVGTIPVVCSSYIQSGGDVVLTIDNLQYVYDLNFDKHVLSVNDGISNVVLSGETEVNSVALRPDLSRMYTIGTTLDTVFQHILDVPGDVTTARLLNTAFSLTSGGSDPYGTHFSTNGRYLYTVNLATDTVNQWILSSPWDVSTAKLYKSVVLPNDVAGVATSYEGRNLYVTDTRSNVRQYYMTVPWDVSTILLSNAKTLDVSSRLLNTYGLKLNASGSKLFIVNDNSTASTTSNAVYQYNLTESWNVSTASYSTFLNVTPQEQDPRDLHLRDDGMRLYVVGEGSDRVIEYALSTADDLATATYTTNNLNIQPQDTAPRGVGLSSDGTSVYIVGANSNSLYRYTLSTAWSTSNYYLTNANISVGVMTGETNPTGLFIQPSGSNIYVVGTTNDTVYQIKLGDSFDLSNVVDITSLSISSRELTPQGIHFKDDGTRMFILGQTNVVSAANTVYQYNLSKAWNIQSATFSSHYNATQDTEPKDISFNSDGSRMYIVGKTNDKIYQYDLLPNWALTSGGVSFNPSGGEVSLSGSGITSPTGIYFDSTGTSLYVSDSDTDRVYRYTLTIPWSISTAQYGVSGFDGLKGKDFITLPLKKTVTGVVDQVGYADPLDETSIEIKSRTSSTVTILNTGSLFSKLATAPFLARIPQHLDSRYFDNRCLYVEGTRKTVQRLFDVTNLEGLYTANLGIKTLGASAVKLYVDNIPETGFTITNNNYNVSLDLSNGHSQLKAVVDYYTVPAIEPGDEVTIYDDVKFKITNVSYLDTDAKYNALITGSSVYRIFIDNNISDRVKTGSQIINVSKDIFGTVGNASGATNSFTIDYDEVEYPGTFNLGKYRIYTTTSASPFNRIQVGPDNTIKNVIPGTYVLKTRNTSSYNRASPYTTTTVTINSIPIGKVGLLTATEEIYVDTGQAAASRIIISFNPIADQLATDYEISYRLISVGELTPTLTDYNTVKVPASGVSDDGKIRYVINNVNRGIKTNDRYTIKVRVTPLNGDLRGISSETTLLLQGKQEKPLGLSTFTVRQFQDSIFFDYRVPTIGDQGTPVDLDLNYIDIRRMPGAQTIPTVNDWNILSTRLIKAATPSSGTQAPITAFGTYTFLAKTVNTSGNESDNAAAFTLNVVEPTDITIVKAYDELNPSGNTVSTSVTNNNYLEYYVTSFSNSTNGGVSIAGAGSADNANGWATGWSQGTDSNLQTLFTTGATANYQTKVRSLDSAITGAIKINYDYQTILTKQYTTVKNTIFSGTSQSAESSLNEWSSMSGGNAHTLALDTKGKLYAWGTNIVGQLGTNDIIDRPFPIKVSDSSWTAVSTCGDASYAIRVDGRLFSWGFNNSGQLGDDTIATTVNRSSPVSIGTSSWSQISAGTSSTYAIRSDGRLFSWGNNTDGRLGLNDTVSRSSPVAIDTTSSWTTIATISSAGTTSRHAGAIKVDKSLWMWGYGTFGVLGNGSSITRSSPVQIGSSSWTALSLGYLHTFAIRLDGALFTWGANANGVLGDWLPTPISGNRNSPVQVGTSSWIAISVGAGNGRGITYGNKLFTWGYNAAGSLGLSDIIDRSSPVQVGTSSWIAVSGGRYNVGAIRSGNHLFNWGFNTYGQLGLGDTITRSSPVVVGLGLFRAQGIGTYLLDATYSSTNKTLSNGGATGNVFAIWNTNTDIGNSNSYALIAGVIDDNTVVLSNTYYANGNPTYSNVFSNLTTSYTGAFSLVNLDQYADSTTVPYSGTSAAITPRLWVRYSDNASAFHANSNLIVGNFTAFEEVGSGRLVPRATFKHFQLRLDLVSSDPEGTGAKLTAFNYYLQLTKKSYETTITLSANPVTIDYTSQGFSVTPTLVSGIAQNAGYPVIPEVTSASTTSSTVKLYKLDGSLPTGITVKFRFEGA